jgi:hypothetical protein
LNSGFWACKAGTALWGALVAHVCNPSYSGGRDQEDRSSKPARANNSARPYLEKSFTKKGWWSDSRWRHWVQKKKKKKGINSAILAFYRRPPNNDNPGTEITDPLLILLKVLLYLETLKISDHTIKKSSGGGPLPGRPGRSCPRLPRAPPPAFQLSEVTDRHRLPGSRPPG